MSRSDGGQRAAGRVMGTLPLRIAICELPGEPLPFAEAVRRPFVPFAVGQAWGGRWGTAWFHLTGEVPPAWAGSEVVARIHLGGDGSPGFSAEGLIWSPDGRPLQGLHHHHRTFRLDGVGPVDLYVEAAANPAPPWGMADWPPLMPDYGGPRLYRLEQADIATVDPPGARPETAVPDGVLAVGHAHIDSAWLWPVRETKRKCARTFANQLRLMERYPEHRFACSQAVHYQWMKDDYPALYAQIRERVREGRWEAVGGMWVEPDTNIPSGESLVRQILYGKRFFARELGVESHVLWIPDVFGYSAALPQIAAAAGLRMLVTQKMSWNDTNRFPHTTFWWEGHDGSRILAHFPPASTYNGQMTAEEAAAGSGPRLYPFGYGDGGGGPTAEMLERARRMPGVRIGTAEEFLAQTDGAGLPTWVGELYFEYHRGTLTTHADVKAGNRRGEEALRAAEMWAVAAGLDRRAELETAWRALLFQQFHDILPGSGIHWVYEDAAAAHAEVMATARAVAAEAMGRISAGSGPGLVFNAAAHDRTEVVEAGGALAVVSAPACGWAPLRRATAPPPVQVGPDWMRNDQLRVHWDRDGLLDSIWDLASGREVLAAGCRGNVFHLFEDRPARWDAWNIDRAGLASFEELTALEAVEVVESDPLRCAVRFVRRFGASRIAQRMVLAAGSRRLEFHTEVDWRERHRLLKVAFEVAVRSARATYEIQHGHIERPTVANTSWDEARYEVCGHRWADLSESGYGVALLNDCKYGYDIRGSRMRLSLLRGPGFPDPSADEGIHRFAYALLPHAGDLRDVIEAAEAFNLPLTVLPGGGGPGRVVAVDRRGVSVEAVKWAEDGDGVIVRICEVWGARGPVRVTLQRPFTAVTRCDLLERPLGPAAVDLDLRPFEVVTLRFA